MPLTQKNLTTRGAETGPKVKCNEPGFGKWQKVTKNRNGTRRFKRNLAKHQKPRKGEN